jgi:hypothetical protein
VTEKLDEIGWVPDEGKPTKECDEVKVEGEEEEPGTAEYQRRTGSQRHQAA